MRRLILSAAVLAAITATPVHADPEYRGCISYEDDSFVCGHLVFDGLYSPPILDRTQPWISGCMPGGYCDTPDTQDQPYTEVIIP